MREEDDPHGAGLKQTADAEERKRVGAVYAAYGASARKQRAWSAENPGNRAIRDEVVAALLEVLPEGGSVLDAGCGSGWLLARLAAAGVAPERLHGVEVIEDRAARAAAATPGADVRLGDVRSLPFADASFDAVFFLTVLSSLDSAGDVRAALVDARRVVRPGGRIVVWEPRVPTPGNRTTIRIRRAELEAVLGPPSSAHTLTLLPPLARRLGQTTPRLYPWLSRVPALRTHRLWTFTAGASGA